MNWITKRIENFRKRPLLGKIIDLTFYLLLIALLFPQGRMAFRQFFLSLPFFGPQIEFVEEVQQEDLASVAFSVDGKHNTLADYPGEVLFIHYWATWCGPCQAELPKVAELYKEFGSREGLRFLTLTYEAPQITSEYLSKVNLELPVGILRRDPLPKFYAEALPTTIVVNKKGEIVLRKEGMANWTSSSFYQQFESLINETESF